MADRPSPRPLTDQERDDIIHRYTQDRQSIRAIMEATGRSYGTVYRALVRAGVTMWPQGGTGHRGCPYGRQSQGGSDRG